MQTVATQLAETTEDLEKLKLQRQQLEVQLQQAHAQIEAKTQVTLKLSCNIQPLQQNAKTVARQAEIARNFVLSAC